MTIIIADDNRQMREFLKSFFPVSEYEIIECVNGLEVCEKYNLVMPDYVLMDIKMPLMDGIEATRQILKDFPGARIIMITENDDKSLREEAEKAGAKGYILKDDLSFLRALLH